MTSDLLGVSISGLRASQTALRTAGHNISNADTAGYSRQRVEVTTNPANFTGAGFTGNGVSVSAIERIANEFVSERVRQDTSLFNEQDTFFQNANQIDQALSDAATGLNQGLQSFFAALQNGKDDPTSIPARQLILSESQNLVDRFTTLYSRFETLEQALDDELEVAVTDLNTLVSSIAQLNRSISEADALGGQATPNDLLDQRDEALRQLSELIGIQVYDQGLNQVNVVIGNGQPLVIGTDSLELSLVNGQLNFAQKEIAFEDAVGLQVISDVLSGGKLGGLLEFRNDILDTAFNELGRIAVAVADNFNKFHQEGIDLNNNFGGLLFSDVNSAAFAAERVKASSGNAPPNNGILSVEVMDSSVMTASDYLVEFNDVANLFTVTRLSDDTEVASGLLPGIFPYSVEFEGLRLNFVEGTFSVGDQFLIQPSRSMARDIELLIVNPEELAFGKPLVTDADLGNTGSGVIDAGSVLDLEDVDGNPLPLFAVEGEMSPPLLIKFITPERYDVLDNSDPANPVQLDPPIRNQLFIPGQQNAIFNEDPYRTMIVADGEMLGLPTGSRSIVQSAITPPLSVAPDVTTVTDFTASTEQFAFDVRVTNTIAATGDGTWTVRINGPSIISEDALLEDINDDLVGSGVEAYMNDTGTLSFRLLAPGDGDIILENYDDDPDVGLDTAPVGQANALLGFDIESTAVVGTVFTTENGLDGISGRGVIRNNYPAEVITVTTVVDPAVNITTEQTVITPVNASAREIATLLSGLEGVEASAFTELMLSDFDLTLTEPLQIQVNGENIIEYNFDPTLGTSVLSSSVPDPVALPNDFKHYLADQINENQNLQAAGIRAESATDSVTGRTEVRIFSIFGDDIQISLEAAAGETIQVSEAESNNVVLTGAGNSLVEMVVIGGRFDVALGQDVSLETIPPDSLLFGDSAAADFAKATYLGIQASITGFPDPGDIFAIDFNEDASNDNRNIIEMVDLELAKTVNNGISSFSESYGTLVEEVGIRTSSARINAEAGETVLQQSEDFRASLSGVNLDEEAAILIKFEQVYAANAQAISVARTLFDRLLSAF